MSTADNTPVQTDGRRVRLLARGAIILALVAAAFALTAGVILGVAILQHVEEKTIRELLVVKAFLTVTFIVAAVHAWRRHRDLRRWQQAQKAG